MSDDEDDGWDADLPAWASIAVANATGVAAPAERRAAGQPRAPAPQQTRRTDVDLLVAPRPETNLLERRRSDRGAPSGQPDRRQPRSFGRRPTH